jgi:recombination protein RecA
MAKAAKKAAPAKAIRTPRVIRSAGGGNYFANPKEKIPFISSGCTTLDLALGGGWAEGRVANIIGDKATGKTLQAIEAAANFAMKYSKVKAKVRYRESEAAFDIPYARALGMPIERIDFGADKPMETVEDFFEDLAKIVDGAKTPELVILDSLDALSDRAELARSMDEGTYGAAKAKKLSELFRRLVGKMERKLITLMVISQVRDNINARAFGRQWTRSGGKALDFYASQILVLANTGKLTQTVLGQKRAIGVKVIGRVDKNKVGLPFRDASYQIRFGYGVDDAQSMVDFLQSTKRLKEANIKESEVKGFLNYLLEDCTPEEMDGELAMLRKLCTKVWYEIESKTLTPRAKYAA